MQTRKKLNGLTPSTCRYETEHDVPAKGGGRTCRLHELWLRDLGLLELWNVRGARLQPVRGIGGG
jgi:hypothetical protein